MLWPLKLPSEHRRPKICALDKVLRLFWRGERDVEPSPLFYGITEANVGGQYWLSPCEFYGGNFSSSHGLPSQDSL